MDGIMATLRECVVNILSFVLTAVLLLGIVIVVFQCFVYMLPWLIVFGGLTVIVVGLCKGFWDWFSNL